MDDFKEVIGRLNVAVSDVDEYSTNCFNHIDSGHIDYISFNYEILWDSENDDRDWLEEENRYSDLFEHIVYKFNLYISEINKIKNQLKTPNHAI